MDVAEKLWEIEQIKQLKARFFRLLDTEQWDLWADCFTEDLELQVDDAPEGSDRDGGPLPGPGAGGRDALVRSRSSSTHIRMSRHHGHMPEIELTSPTTATGIWASYSYNERDGGSRTQSCGWYEEEYRKEADAKWRISRMRVTGLVHTSPDR